LAVHFERRQDLEFRIINCRRCRRRITGSSVVKRLWLTGLAGLALSALAVVPAQAEVRIGVVNYSKLMQESPQYKAVQDALRGEFAGKQRELSAQQAALKAKQDKLEKDGTTMTADQRTKAEKELRDGNRDYSQKVSDFQEEATARQNEELSRLQSALIAEVQSYALSQKYDLVLADGVIYAANSFDITSAVLASLQARGATPAAAAPAATPKPAAPAPK
jgi:outer membrane protein